MRSLEATLNPEGSHARPPTVGPSNDTNLDLTAELVILRAKLVAMELHKEKQHAKLEAIELDKEGQRSELEAMKLDKEEQQAEIEAVKLEYENFRAWIRATDLPQLLITKHCARVVRRASPLALPVPLSLGIPYRQAWRLECGLNYSVSWTLFFHSFVPHTGHLDGDAPPKASRGP